MPPGRADRKGTGIAYERSRRRLGTNRIDLYVLHCRGGPALGVTLRGFEAMVRAGKIRHWGVSAFDVSDMQAQKVASPGFARTAATIAKSLKN